jgi:hypothetical protein
MAGASAGRAGGTIGGAGFASVGSMGFAATGAVGFTCVGSVALLPAGGVPGTVEPTSGTACGVCAGSVSAGGFGDIGRTSIRT